MSFPNLVFFWFFYLAFAPILQAQLFTNMYSFTVSDFSPFTNRDGANPQAALILSGNTLYGTAAHGGSSGNGSIFKVNIDGTDFTNLHSFTGPYNNHTITTNEDGANPLAGLVISGNTLYGTASGGGSSGNGVVFAIYTDGTGFTNLHTFSATDAGTNNDGSTPVAGLTLSGNTLFGTTSDGGGYRLGTVFAIDADGTDFTNLHNFSPTAGPPIASTNADGADPAAGLVLSGNTLYGSAQRGGSSGVGSLFRVNTDGTDFTNLHNFSAGSESVGNGNSITTNNDGRLPSASLVLSGTTLYGTAESGGNFGAGTVFAINTDGTGFTNLHSFTYPETAGSNSDGAFPMAGLVFSGEKLYGTTDNGGSQGVGIIFALNTDGGDFANLYSFAPIGGFYSEAGLIIAGNALFGTTTEGGNESAGTVFSLTLPLPPQLNITSAGANIILTWPTNATGFTLESTTNLMPPSAWSVISGQYAVTNPITVAQTFYRLCPTQP